MVEHPIDYKWSSYAVNSGAKHRRNLVKHYVYQCLGNTEEACYFAYRALFSVDLASNLVHDIQRASSFSMPLGNNKFQEQVAEALAIKIGYSKLGRPKNFIK